MGKSLLRLNNGFLRAGLGVVIKEVANGPHLHTAWSLNFSQFEHFRALYAASQQLVLSQWVDLIGGAAIRSPTPEVSVSKCPWARHCTLNWP